MANVNVSSRSIKTDAARIIKVDIEMFHDEIRKSTYFRVKRSKVNVTTYKKHCLRECLYCCECWLLIVHNHTTVA